MTQAQKYRQITQRTIDCCGALARTKGSFADAYPDLKAVRCLHPGAEHLTLSDVTRGSKLYFEWRCSENPEHVWPATPNNRSRYGCKHCYNLRRSETIQKAKTGSDRLLKDLYPEHYAQLLRVINKSGREIDKEGVAAQSNAVGYWVIPGCLHGEFDATVADRVRGPSTEGCQHCTSQRDGDRERSRSVAEHGSLQTTHPTLAVEWVAPARNYAGRADISPGTCSAHSGIDVLWRCWAILPNGDTCDHEWVAKICDRTREDGKTHHCSDCANRDSRGQGKRGIAITRNGSVADHPRLGPEFMMILKPSHKQHLTASLISVASKYLCAWQCSVHPGEFIFASPSSRMANIKDDGIAGISGCRKCNSEKKRAWGLTQGIERSGTIADRYPMLALEWVRCDEAPKMTPENTSCGSHLSVLWKCSRNSSHPEWPADVFHRTGLQSGCPECFNERRPLFSPQAALRRSGSLAESNPDIAAQFVRCLTAPGRTANDLTFGSRECCEWYCDEHEQHFTALVHDRTSGKVGCRQCGLLAISAAIRQAGIERSGTLRDHFPDIAAQWVKPVEAVHQHLDPNSLSPGSGVYAYWECKRHDAPFIWPATVGNRTQGFGCPKCNESKGEKAVSLALTARSVPFRFQQNLKDLVSEFGRLDLQVSGRLRYDFSILDESCKRVVALVEYHGYQHYAPVNFGRADRSIKEIKAAFEAACARDVLKADIARQLGLPLLVIPYWQFQAIDAILGGYLEAPYLVLLASQNSSVAAGLLSGQTVLE